MTLNVFENIIVYLLFISFGLYLLLYVIERFPFIQGSPFYDLKMKRDTFLRHQEFAKRNNRGEKCV
jgi:hypothetical protein